METLLQVMNINTVFFTVAGYPMSYLEFFGTVFSIWCVWLTARAKVLSWPVGLVGSVLYLALFYQIQLYSDVLEQGYFIVTSLLGWWVWSRAKKDSSKVTVAQSISWNSSKENTLYLFILVGGTTLLAFVTMHLHVWFPVAFPVPVSLPVLDAFTTVMSFLAQWLLVRRKIESWVLWIAVDVIAIGLYWYKDVKFISLEYVLFLFLATWGLVQWLRMLKAKQ